MASINKRREKNAKKPYVLSYFDPVKGKWQKATFQHENDANEELRRWENIAHYFKTNNPIWHAMYYQADVAVTIQDVFDSYTTNVLDTKLNQLTSNRYMSVMNSVAAVFPLDTPIDNIRGTKKDGLLGWEIYKAHRSKTCKRNGINSYLRDLRNIFMWATTNGGSQGRGMVNFEVITKTDRYNASEVEDLEFKIWEDNEILSLFNHPKLSEFQRDILTLYTYTGARAKELVGYNYRNRKKELEWHHIDFNERTISLLPKRKKTRKLAKQHPIVMDILRKWKDQGKEKPLPFAYNKLNRIIKEINAITKIQFTCHDLRRLKAQLAEEENGDIQLAGYAIGDSTQSVVTKHYAPVSHATMDKINDSIDNAFNRKIGVA
jgi:integrase